MPETFLVYGPPGCGKTTWIVRQAAAALERYDTGDAFDTSPILFSSLTRAAAGELKLRGMDVPEDRIGTLHAHAFRALGKPKLATGKQLDEFNQLCKAEHIVSGETELPDRAIAVSKACSGDKLLGRYAVYRARLTPRNLWDVAVQRFADEYETWKRASGTMDFADLIDEAYAKCPTAPSEPRVLFQDEAQDSDRAQFRLLMKWAGAPSCEKLVVVGDPDQNLYEWRGSEPEAFHELQRDPKHVRVLKQSYRVPRTIHALAVRVMARAKRRRPVEYLARDIEGEIRTVDRRLTTASDAAYLVNDAVERYLATDFDEETKAPRVMFLASCEYMLTPIMQALRAKGIQYWNPYSRDRGGFNPLHPGHGRSAASRLLDYLRPSTAVWGDDARLWTAGELLAWTEHLESKGLLKRGAKAKVKELGETAASRLVEADELVGLFDSPDAFATAAELSIAWFENRLLSSKRSSYKFPLAVAKRHGAVELRRNPRVCVGTIHSVKGGEADVVYVAPDLSPQGFQAYRSAYPDPIYRLFYVAVTRARETLVLCRRAAPGSAFFSW